MRAGSGAVLAAVALFLGTVQPAAHFAAPYDGTTLLALIPAAGLGLALAALIQHLQKGGGPLPEAPLPGPVRRTAAVVLVALCAVTAALVLRRQAMSIGSYLLPRTPRSAVVLAMLAAAGYLAGRLRRLEGVCRLLVPVILVPLAAVLVTAALTMDWAELTTLLRPRWDRLPLQLAQQLPLALALVPLALIPLGGRGVTAAVGGCFALQGVLLAVLTGTFTLAGLEGMELPLAELIRSSGGGEEGIMERLDALFLAGRTALAVLSGALLLHSGGCALGMLVPRWGEGARAAALCGGTAAVLLAAHALPPAVELAGLGLQWAGGAALAVCAGIIMIGRRRAG